MTELILFGIRTYIVNSLKESTREKRGKGVRRKVKLPTNFPDFLWDLKNKTELFELLTAKVAEYDYPPGNSLHHFRYRYYILGRCTNDCSLLL